MMMKTLLVCWLTCVNCLVALAADDATNPIQLTDVTKESGITFEHSTGSGGQGFLVEGVVGGLALFDFDNDGLIDIYFTNGAPLQGSHLAEGSLRPALYRNLGGMKFVDVTNQAGIGFRGYGLGAVAADYDNDRDQDLFLTNFGSNVLYRNNGNSTFTDVTVAAGVQGSGLVGAGACFLDADNDGNLDLFVASYVDFSADNHVPIKVKGQFVMAGPQYYPSLPDSFYRNRGDGTFEDQSLVSGVGRIKGPGMGAIAADFDDDGDQDIFVAQDGAANLLLVNDGTGKFSDEAMVCGVGTTFDGKTNGSMGVDGGDIDNDGLIDLFVTSYQSEMPVLYRNLGSGLFEDATRKAQIPNTLYPHVNWGTGIVDFDNDGRKDIFIANGHFDRVELMDDRTAKKLRNTLLLNVGNGKFKDVSSIAGNGLTIVESSRGTGFDDLDNDGDVDVVVLNSDAAPSILRNDSTGTNQWIQLRLQGSSSNKDGVGSKIVVKAGQLVVTSQVVSGRGYQSHFGARQYFGLGQSDQIRVEVGWPSGKKSVFDAIEANKVHLLTE
jgi:enediyne biosynthesis protein E4